MILYYLIISALFRKTYQAWPASGVRDPGGENCKGTIEQTPDVLAEQEPAGCPCLGEARVGGAFIDLDIRLKKSFGLEGKDAWSLAGYFKPATGDIIGYKAEFTRPEPNVVSYRLHPPCLWFPDLDIPPSFCEALGCFEKEAAKIVNPDIEIRHVQLMTAGDPICEIHFIEKETPDRQDGEGR